MAKKFNIEYPSVWYTNERASIDWVKSLIAHRLLRELQDPMKPMLPNFLTFWKI